MYNVTVPEYRYAVNCQSFEVSFLLNSLGMCTLITRYVSYLFIYLLFFVCLFICLLLFFVCLFPFLSFFPSFYVLCLFLYFSGLSFFLTYFLSFHL